VSQVKGAWPAGISRHAGKVFVFGAVAKYLGKKREFTFPPPQDFFSLRRDS
jgi:hypothetical protein